MQSPPSAHAYGNLTRAVIHTHCMHRCESLLKEKEKVSAKAAQLRARLSTQTQRANKAERALTNMNPEFQRLRGMKKHLSSELQMFVGCHTANRHVCMHHAYTTYHVCTCITHTHVRTRSTGAHIILHELCIYAMHTRHAHTSHTHAPCTYIYLTCTCSQTRPYVHAYARTWKKLILSRIVERHVSCSHTP